MKKCIWLIFIMIFVISVSLIAQDDVGVTEVVSNAVLADETIIPVSSAVSAVEATKEASIGQNLWIFMNSSLGISIIGFILAFVLGKIFTAKPKWKSIVLQYGPKLMQAVKMAEKNIPNDIGNAGLARLDEALRYLIQLEPKLGPVASEDLKQALTAVHATAETNGNLE